MSTATIRSRSASEARIWEGSGVSGVRGERKAEIHFTAEDSLLLTSSRVSGLPGAVTTRRESDHHATRYPRNPAPTGDDVDRNHVDQGLHGA
ncbi:hypothetical protein GCM10010116_18080 [Microbispora rosea subsp. aerata]|nr:hypothetical protein GCM10010116_18080 [Microbispora rosea subsp. aerata]